MSPLSDLLQGNLRELACELLNFHLILKILENLILIVKKRWLDVVVSIVIKFKNTWNTKVVFVLLSLDKRKVPRIEVSSLISQMFSVNYFIPVWLCCWNLKLKRLVIHFKGDNLETELCEAELGSYWKHWALLQGNSILSLWLFGHTAQCVLSPVHPSPQDTAHLTLSWVFEIYIHHFQGWNESRAKWGIHFKCKI